jgi:hypothetical protein
MSSGSTVLLSPGSVNRTRTFLTTTAPVRPSAASAAPVVHRATRDAGWASGVTWNKGEAARFAVIERLNGHGVEYAKCADDLGSRYVYRSHYNTKALVQIGNFRMGSIPRENCMVILVDDPEDRVRFNFAKAVRTELDWLKETGVVTMSLYEREDAENSLADQGYGQYWTALRKVLPYSGHSLVELAGARDGKRIPGGSECGNPPELGLVLPRR